MAVAPGRDTQRGIAESCTMLVFLVGNRNSVYRPEASFSHAFRAHPGPWRRRRMRSVTFDPEVQSILIAGERPSKAACCIIIRAWQAIHLGTVSQIAGSL